MVNVHVNCKIPIIPPGPFLPERKTPREIIV